MYFGTNYRLKKWFKLPKLIIIDVAKVLVGFMTNYINPIILLLLSEFYHKRS